MLGTLAPEQQQALHTLLSQQTGILIAQPGAGKTVIGCAAIAKLGLKTLVLVHRTPLLEQWRLRLGEFLGLKPKAIGILSKKRKLKDGPVDLAMIQSLVRYPEDDETFSRYGLVIVDEAHHLPAVTFEGVLKRFTAQHVYGLTATPERPDGLQRILYQQCGDVRHVMEPSGEDVLEKKVLVRPVSFEMPEGAGPQPPIHLMWDALTKSKTRTEAIAQDVAQALTVGCTPLLISERREHLEALAQAIQSQPGLTSIPCFYLVGQTGKKDRRKDLEDIQACIDQSQPFIILATGSFVGEGFDLPALDTLFLAMPVSFKGRVVQYTGRLHRPFPDKTVVQVYDYVDTHSPLTLSMYRKRLVAYGAMGYAIEAPETLMPRRKAARLGRMPGARLT